MSNNGSVCGRPYLAEPAGRVSKGSETKGKTRYTVDGVAHPSGKSIRFKSLQRAENHIRNMGLER